MSTAVAQASVMVPSAPTDSTLPSGLTGPSVTDTAERAKRDTPASASASVEPEPEGANTSADAEGSGSGSAPVHRVRKKRLGVDPSLIISEERSKRRRSPSPSAAKQEDPDPRDPARAAALGREVIQRITAKKASDGESMSEPFLKLPNKRQFPDYYDMIKHPMSLEIVEEKLTAMEYQTLKEICGDLGQMFTNAKRYVQDNIRESLIFQYAKKLHKMTRTFYTQQTTPDKPESDSDAEQEGEPKAEATPDLGDDGFDGYGDDDVEMFGGGPSETGDGTDGLEHGDADGFDVKSSVPRKRGTYMKDGPTVYKLIKPVLRAIKEARAVDGSGREIAGIFLSLPDRRELPDYYKAIKQPISLKEIEDKMVARKYDTYEEFFEDVELMCANAMVYNEDESEVYKDAQQIRDILGHQRAEVIERLKVPKVDKFRVKAATVTPVRFGSNGSAGYDHRPSPLVPYGASPTSTAGQLPYGAMPQTATAYPSQSPIGTGSSGTRYLPPLPPGVVNEEIVASLDKYPLYEQQAWLTTLPPQGIGLYRQILGALEARKRGYAQQAAPPTTLIPPAQSPSSYPPPALSHRQPEPASAAAYSPSGPRPDIRSPLATAAQPPHRAPPPQPLVKRFDFTFSTRSYHSQTQQDAHRPTIRLHNMRGVITHAVLIGPETTEIELAAYPFEDDSESRGGSATADLGLSTPMMLDGVAQTPTSANSHAGSMPEMSLRVNGSQTALPRTVYESVANGVVEGQSQRSIGMKWLIPVSFNRTEMKIEVLASRQGAAPESSTIYVNRQ